MRVSPTRLLPVRRIVPVGLVLWLISTANAAEAPMPGTKPLTWEGPVDERMMRDAHRFVERKIAEATARVPGAIAEADMRLRRERLTFLLGAGNRERQPHTHLAFPPAEIPVQMRRIGDDAVPAVVFENAKFRCTRVCWPALEGVHGEGLLLEPKGRAIADVVVVPDADQAPEALAGLTRSLPGKRQLARRLVEHGVRVVVPTLIDRRDVGGDKKLGQSHREWIYRQAFHMGRHVIGYELDKIKAVIDWFEHTREERVPIGIAGWGEGQQHAMYAAAIDPRIDVALVSGRWQQRDVSWRQPIYRNVWSYLSEFGDAMLARMIEPRRLIFETSDEPAIDAVRDKAMPTATVTGEAALPEFRDKAIREFCEAMGVAFVSSDSADTTLEMLMPATARDAFIAARHDRQVRELDAYTQRLVHDSDAVRREFYLNQALPELDARRWSTRAVHETTPVGSFTRHSDRYREIFHRDILGRFDDRLLAPNPRSRWLEGGGNAVRYEVVLDVVPDLFAWGILVLPKDIKAGERRPVIVVQHGRNGLPEKVVNGGYNGIVQKLIDRGYIVFAPHNLYRGEDQYRWLDRKANSIGKTLFSFLLLQHDQITRWLERLPQVDGDRIAFYGNSYGGESAVRIPTVLTRYALSICASDFNDWTRKVADTRDRHSFMRTIEWEMPYFNMGDTFSYAEMAYLMIPRPFMVERGHHDLVAPDNWVASEFAKVRLVYDQLGIGDRTAITFFQGGHTMRGEDTLEFLDRQLRQSGERR